ncbi:Hypothetical predicted protein [Pelobates cultripes]|uniref:Uncharacterized protein n=1 Tax=Pelobates cultripes TaxID=61616 RepID=A0AAD1T7L0_PELCU|nr:Hypothetical predicted protein [Pelobates cultripes]
MTWNLGLPANQILGRPKPEQKLLHKLTLAARRAVAQFWLKDDLPLIETVMDKLTAQVRGTTTALHKICDP